MKLSLITPKSALNKSFLKVKPSRSEIETFKSNLIKLLGNVDVFEREEHHKNFFRDFLRDTYYKDTNLINTKDYKDIVIHLGTDNSSRVGVIIEAKSPSNKSEMISLSKPNCKALQELILYYFDERDRLHNNELKHLIITNVNEWYIFDANIFDKIIYRNSNLKQLYQTYKTDKKDNSFFYEEARWIIDKIENEVPCAYFDIRHYDNVIRNDNKEDDKALIALYKLLSPTYLLKVPFINDSNSLNQNFYRELLHIIGLEEVKSGSKTIIQRKVKDRQDGSLIENTISILKTNNSLRNIKDRSAYGNDLEEQLFNIALELSLTWINRILFLKLLEGLLLTYHKGNKNYCFLNHETIPGFDELFKLFHSVLALKICDRKASVQQKYSKVPYLNSSLFEITELENSTISINSLDDSETIDLISTTVLREEKNRKVTKLAPTEYLFKFLDAYDFASEGGEDIAEDNKTIINASVLGKVFEKINGYKDGSIFTPGFITMYMSRQALRLAVLQKFNDYFKLNNIPVVDTFDELYNSIPRKDIKIANEIINSLRICDPAVGSGHFLVSALNELIVIKSELGILIDKNGKLLKDYEIVVENDELIISDENGIFEYRYNNKESQRVQETIFNEKQTLIENCLFGVDINPNSVQICRLRLWIELLKSSYYRPETLNLSTEPELETLPNIDINIKCGNSLLSRFDLDSDLVQALKKSKWDITSYRNAVATYRNTKSREVKWEMEKLISEIKNSFETEIWLNDKRNIKLSELKGELFTLTNQEALFEMSQKEKDEWNKKVNKLTADIQKQEQIIEEIRNNAIYKNAFEWRFEFPEVLNDNGDFVGFDVVIGNPPYVDIKGLNPDFVKTLFKNYNSTENRINLYSIFIELSHNILKKRGYFSFINPNSILMNSSYAKIRRLIFDEVNEIIKLPDNVFSESDVIVETIILSFQKGMKFENISSIKHKHAEKLEKIDTSLSENHSKDFWRAFEDLKFNIYLTNELQEVLKKIIQNTKPLKDIADFTLGLTPYDKYKGHTEQQITERAFHSNIKIDDQYKPIITGENIQRYYVDNTPKEFIKYGNWLGAPREERFFTQPRVIVRQIVSGNPLRIYAGYTEDALYFSQIGFSIIPEIHIHPKYLTSLMNSSLINFVHKYLYLDIEKELFQKILIENCKKFPIKEIPVEAQQPFIDLVDIILAKKANNEDTSQEEQEIDRLVYQIYDLTEDEIKIVEGE